MAEKPRTVAGLPERCNDCHLEHGATVHCRDALVAECESLRAALVHIQLDIDDALGQLDRGENVLRQVARRILLPIKARAAKALGAST